MQFGIHLVRGGVLSADDFVDVVERQLRERPPLGMLAIEHHKLSIKQLFAVLEAQVEDPKPFGRLAVELGFLSQADLLQLVGMQSERGRPEAEHVVEMGLVDSATVCRELQRFRAASRDQRQELEPNPRVATVAISGA
jgi:hypothetical protein